MTVRRERADGAAVARTANCSLRGAGCASHYRERALDLLAQVGMADAGRAAVQRARLWRRQARRARDRARQRAAPAADGRADRRHGAARAQRPDGADQAARARARRSAVLFTEHSMDVVFAYADRIIVLARGELIADGDAGEMRDNAQVQEVYLGSGTTFDAARGGRAMSDADARRQRPRRLVRRGADPVRRVARGRPRRGGRADGPQRRRQVDHA